MAVAILTTLAAFPDSFFFLKRIYTNYNQYKPIFGSIVCLERIYDTFYWKLFYLKRGVCSKVICSMISQSFSITFKRNVFLTKIWKGFTARNRIRKEKSHCTLYILYLTICNFLKERTDGFKGKLNIFFENVLWYRYSYIHMQKKCIIYKKEW